jgi:nitrite reductase/ring-hydroxylating ferredoxin subunit
MHGRRIAATTDLIEGTTLKFRFLREGLDREGFLARFQGTIVAYENLCRHLPLPLDYDDDRFFATDGRHFVCQTHGAIYEPLTGLCVRGPCAGSSLKSLPIQVRADSVWLLIEE